MFDKPYLIIYWAFFNNNYHELKKRAYTIKEALKKARELEKCFQIHRVEVWKDKFRLLLSVH